MIEEVEKFMNSSEISLNYRTINLGGKVLYIEGIKNVVGLDLKEMIFSLKKGAVFVKGENLKIKYLDKTTCVIEGLIQAVEVK